MSSTQSVSVTSPAVLVLLTGKIFPFGEVFNWICHPSSGRQEWNVEFSLFCGQVSWTQGWPSGDTRGHAGRAGKVGGCALGIWGAPMRKGSAAVWGCRADEFIQGTSGVRLVQSSQKSQQLSSAPVSLPGASPHSSTSISTLLSTYQLPGQFCLTFS